MHELQIQTSEENGVRSIASWTSNLTSLMLYEGLRKHSFRCMMALNSVNTKSSILLIGINHLNQRLVLLQGQLISFPMGTNPCRSCQERKPVVSVRQRIAVAINHLTFCMYMVYKVILSSLYLSKAMKMCSCSSFRSQVLQKKMGCCPVLQMAF